MKYLRDKVAEANRIIDIVLRNFRRPALMWSGGKDSMVLLFMLRARSISLPVIFHREPFFPAKYEFHERIIREWNLQVYDWAPVAVTMQCATHQDVTEIVNHYQVGRQQDGRPATMALPKNLYEVPDGAGQFLCGLRDFIHRPLGTFEYPWDCVLHGHKSSDVDPMLGAVPLTVDVKQNLAGPAAAFPLRQWTDGNVWDYTKAYDVPQQETRYTEGMENPDKELNPDYWACCVRCIDRRAGKTVFCPKLKCEVDNISGQVVYAERPIRPEYIGESKSKEQDQEQEERLCHTHQG